MDLNSKIEIVFTSFDQSEVVPSFRNGRDTHSTHIM